MTLAGKLALSTALFWMLTSPAGCATEVVHGTVHTPPASLVPAHGPCELARGAPRVLNSTPAEAVVSLDMTVLLMMFTFNASCSDTPPPSQPATLLAMMLFVTCTRVPAARAGCGKASTSVPLTLLQAQAAAAAALGRVAHDQVGVDHQARAGAVARRAIVLGRRTRTPVAVDAGRIDVRRAMITMPPPLVGIVGLVLWLNRTVLCSMSPL